VPEGAGAKVNATDNELMAEVRDGDVDKLAILFERNHKRLFNFFVRTTGSRPASEDLVQEVFMRILKYRHTFRAGSEFAPWMYQMARNASADRFERKAREPIAPWADGELAERPAAGPSAADELVRAETAERVRAALLRLPPEKREVLVLSRYELLRYEEIAGMLGCSVGAVKLRVHRALKDLRRLLGPEAAPAAELGGLP